MIVFTFFVKLYRILLFIKLYLLAGYTTSLWRNSWSCVYCSYSTCGYGYNWCRGVIFGTACAAGTAALCTLIVNGLCGEAITVQAIGCAAACAGIVCLPCPDWNIACGLCGIVCEDVCNNIF
ncbi:MAG: hypothetical protein FWH37_06980 [Candidatus Bathyarchaeota archaeon]|nr:hypothetical protein [Candidatus Termiticorpusculum sp.]